MLSHLEENPNPAKRICSSINAKISGYEKGIKLFIMHTGSLNQPINKNFFFSTYIQTILLKKNFIQKNSTKVKNPYNHDT
jgi:hypothetical protein